MKKIVYPLLGLIIVAVLVAPNFIGQKAEREVKTLVEAVNANPAYSVELKSYQRNWFTAEAVLQFAMEFPMPQEDGSQEIVTLNSGDVMLNIQHGPVLSQFVGGLGALSWRLSANDEALRDNLSWSDDSPLYELTGSMGLTGNATYQDAMADFSYRAVAEDVLVNVIGYSGAGNFNGQQFGYRGENKKLALTMAGDLLVVDDIAFSTDAQGSFIDALNAKMMNTDMTLRVAEVRSGSVAVADDKLDVAMQGLEVTADSKLSDDGATGNLNFNTRIATLGLPNGDAKELLLNIEINRLDVEFIQAYQKAMNATYDQPTEVMQEQVEALFSRYLEQVIAADPEFAITQMSGQLPDGDVNGELSLSMGEIESLPAGGVSAEFWLDHLLANGYIQAAKPVVRNALALQLEMALSQQMPNQDVNSEQFQSMIEQQVNQVVNVYLQQGFMEEEGGNFESAFELKEGTLSLNGKPIPLI